MSMTEGTPAAAAPATTVEPAPAQPAAAPANPQENDPAYWRDKFEREVAGRRSERSLYRPAMDAFEGLHADDIAQLRELGKAVARGDAEYITEWGLATISNVNGGKPAADVIAARMAGKGGMAPTDLSTAGQAAAAAAVAPATPVQALDPAQLAELVAQTVDTRLSAREQEAQQRENVARLIAGYNERIATAGIERGSDAYFEVIELTRAFQGDIEKAIRVQQASATAQQVGVAAAAQQAAATPPPAPNGVPTQGAPAKAMTPIEKVRARMSGTQA